MKLRVALGALLMLAGCDGEAGSGGGPSVAPTVRGSSSAVVASAPSGSASTPASSTPASSTPPSAAAPTPSAAPASSAAPTHGLFDAPPSPDVEVGQVMTLFKLDGPGHAIELDVPKGWKGNPNYDGMSESMIPGLWTVLALDASGFVIALCIHSHREPSIVGLADGWTRRSGGAEGLTWEEPEPAKLGRDAFAIQLRRGTATRRGKPATLWQIRRYYKAAAGVTHLIVAGVDDDAPAGRREELLNIVRSYRMRPPPKKP